MKKNQTFNFEKNEIKKDYFSSKGNEENKPKIFAFWKTLLIFWALCKVWTSKLELEQTFSSNPFHESVN